MGRSRDNVSVEIFFINIVFNRKSLNYKRTTSLPTDSLKTKLIKRLVIGEAFM